MVTLSYRVAPEDEEVFKLYVEPIMNYWAGDYGVTLKRLPFSKRARKHVLRSDCEDEERKVDILQAQLKALVAWEHRDILERNWRSGERGARRIEILEGSVVDFVSALRADYPKNVVDPIVLFIACSQRGLSTDELSEILVLLELCDAYQHLAAIGARLAPALMKVGKIWRFRDGAMARDYNGSPGTFQTVQSLFTEEEREAAHATLFQYWLNYPETSARRAEEIVYPALVMEEWGIAREYLDNAQYIRNCALSNTLDLYLRDSVYLSKALPEVGELPYVNLWGRGLVETEHRVFFDVSTALEWRLSLTDMDYTEARAWAESAKEEIGGGWRDPTVEEMKELWEKRGRLLGGSLRERFSLSTGYLSYVDAGTKEGMRGVLVREAKWEDKLDLSFHE